MNSNKHSIKFVASNLTKVQFNGFCEGMALVYTDRSSRKNDDQHAISSMLWWESAYGKYNHYCKYES